MTRSFYVLRSNPVSGRDDDYNEWYQNRHLADVLAIPGFVSAQRYRLAENPRNRRATYRYMVVYELEGDADVALTALGDAMSNGMEISDAMDVSREGRPEGFVYEMLGETKVADSGL